MTELAIVLYMEARSEAVLLYTTVLIIDSLCRLTGFEGESINGQLWYPPLMIL